MARAENRLCKRLKVHPFLMIFADYNPRDVHFTDHVLLGLNLRLVDFEEL